MSDERFDGQLSKQYLQRTLANWWNMQSPMWTNHICSLETFEPVGETLFAFWFSNSFEFGFSISKSHIFGSVGSQLPAKRRE